MAKIRIIKEKSTQEVDIQQEQETRKVHIVEAPEYGVCEHILITKTKGEKRLTINGLKIDDEVFQIIKNLINDEFN